MRRQAEIEACRERGDFDAFGNAAAIAEVRLEDVGRTVQRQVAEGKARRLALAAGDRDAAGRADLGDAEFIVGRYRLLKPRDVLVAHELGEAFGFGDRIGAVRVDHDVDVGPEGLTRLSYTFGRDMGRPIHGADTHFDGAK